LTQYTLPHHITSTIFALKLAIHLCISTGGATNDGTGRCINAMIQGAWHGIPRELNINHTHARPTTTPHGTEWTYAMNTLHDRPTSSTQVKMVRERELLDIPKPRGYHFHTSFSFQHLISSHLCLCMASDCERACLSLLRLGRGEQRVSKEMMERCVYVLFCLVFSVL